MKKGKYRKTVLIAGDKDVQWLIPDVLSEKREMFLSEIMGRSASIQNVIQQVNKVAETNYTVIIEGETGTGKEVIANAIHRQSRRHDGPFVVVDCGAIPETLIESELFGHEKGAFTGAHQSKDGYFYLANHGTIFLDEISNLSLIAQCKLLRAIEERKIHLVGSESAIPVDVRIIAASNLPLDREMTAGRFKSDLYHRLNDFCITLPPLRERKEDIIFLAERFIQQACVELKKTILKLSNEAIEELINHPWPGNVRELRNAVKRAALLADNVIRPEHLAFKTRGYNMENADEVGALVVNDDESRYLSSMKDVDREVVTFRGLSTKVTADAEKALIQEALKKTNGNKSKATRLLKITYKTLYNKIKKYNIEFKG